MTMKIPRKAGCNDCEYQLTYDWHILNKSNRRAFAYYSCENGDCDNWGQLTFSV